jgi:hypothetical protein
VSHGNTRSSTVIIGNWALSSATENLFFSREEKMKAGCLALLSAENADASVLTFVGSLVG